VVWGKRKKNKKCTERLDERTHEANGRLDFAGYFLSSPRRGKEEEEMLTVLRLQTSKAT
jgi:hypothetical protein